MHANFDISATKCPFALWLNFNIAFYKEYSGRKVIKCRPNYTPQDFRVDKTARDDYQCLVCT